MGAVVIVGRSCCGKTSVKKELCKRSRYSSGVTCTTRSPRVGEVDGVHYHFLSQDVFLAKKKSGEFAETTEYAGNLYGTLCKDLEGDDIKVLVLEPSGAFEVKKNMGDKAFVVSITVDPETCYEGLRARGEDEESIRKRMEEDDILFGNVLSFADFFIDNTCFQLSVKEVANEIHRAVNIFF